MPSVEPVKRGPGRPRKNPANDSGGTVKPAVEVVAEPVVAEVKEVPPLRPFAIESAPLNSKATVGAASDGLKEARLTTPLGGTVVLPRDDLMWTLPVGAKIRKLSEVQYVAVQMNPQHIHPPLVTVSARDAVSGFNDHFHPRGQ